MLATGSCYLLPPGVEHLGLDHFGSGSDQADGAGDPIRRWNNLLLEKSQKGIPNNCTGGQCTNVEGKGSNNDYTYN